MKKSQHAPWCLVRDEAVGQGEQNRVERDETGQPNIHSRQPLAREGGERSYTRQNQNQAFAPDRPVALMKDCQPLQIKAERMNMRRMSAGPVQPWQIAAQRVQRAAEMGEKGGEENHGNHHGRGQGGESVL